ncbi:hypothetical protein ACRE_033640 [Hapsidospora chrysogenum ATCC 11550]|uniref:Uncharacterized protein n=1 Tax=Hapsidospora chrysogenum (strain ATCC 11550 / CBS 779.69 / DSM 880 / IAM 14645 / JCM 23072 / IMI 49137) TaxID=857340 RepID=A0A086T8W1_HAPC1|nr:hypothetical protein ACRE_033640 [Hapsidospora chrysogenum ATCC 11550]
MDEALEDAALVLEHPKLLGVVEAMAGSQEGRQLGSDIGLLGEELGDGGIAVLILGSVASCRGRCGRYRCGIAGGGGPVVGGGLA